MIEIKTMPEIMDGKKGSRLEVKMEGEGIEIVNETLIII